MRPRLLVLDEPTSQMDPIGAREVFGVVRKMAEEGMTVVMVEHKVEWIASFADRVIALKEGQILLEGSASEVLTSEGAGRKWVWRFALHIGGKRGEEKRAVEEGTITSHFGRSGGRV